jgi:hypothetical protein
MKKNKETLIRELHQRLMAIFMAQVVDSVSGIHTRAEKDVGSAGTAPVADAPGVAAAPGPLDSPDKLNVIRQKVATDQNLVILDPDKQKELLEIIRQAYEEFEHQLRGIVSNDKSLMEVGAQKFKDELLANTRKELAEKNRAFAE